MKRQLHSQEFLGTTDRIKIGKILEDFISAKKKTEPQSHLTFTLSLFASEKPINGICYPLIHRHRRYPNQIPTYLTATNLQRFG